mmetsp:Transcript_20317/g.48154  ORF Transcript_20317/g.48154 Transcript_20317/m.48154 type:complete len:328 (+) Transcript_20317:1067-2050(+)
MCVVRVDFDPPVDQPFRASRVAHQQRRVSYRGRERFRAALRLDLLHPFGRQPQRTDAIVDQLPEGTARARERKRVLTPDRDLYDEDDDVVRLVVRQQHWAQRAPDRRRKNQPNQGGHSHHEDRVDLIRNQLRPRDVRLAPIRLQPILHPPLHIHRQVPDPLHAQRLHRLRHLLRPITTLHHIQPRLRARLHLGPAVGEHGETKARAAQDSPLAIRRRALRVDVCWGFGDRGLLLASELHAHPPDPSRRRDRQADRRRGDGEGRRHEERRRGNNAPACGRLHLLSGSTAEQRAGETQVREDPEERRPEDPRDRAEHPDDPHPRARQSV